MNDKKKIEAAVTMGSILQAYGEKCLGNALTVSSQMQHEADLFKGSIEKIAEDIARHATLMGQRPVPGSGKVSAFAELSTDATTIAAKIYTVMSATPEQFIAFMGFRMEELRGEAASCKADSKFQRDRFLKIATHVRANTPPEELRKMVDEMLGYDEEGNLEEDEL